MPLTAGDTLGPYEIISLIGKGGMGEVYKARDTRLDRIVAIKTSAEKFSARFEQEARAVAALNHPNICTLHDVGPNYLVMEYIDGPMLKGPLPAAKALEYAGQILDALNAAHQKGIIHRDLKPANILVTGHGVKLLDFGLAKLVREREQTEATQTIGLTRAGEVMGTPAYMPPEQWEGKSADARSDIYTFGCVLYEMLTGKRPGRERTPLRLMRLEIIVRRCLANDPDLRWQSAAEVKQHLQGALANPAWKYGVAAAAVLLVAAASVLLWQRPHSAPLAGQDVVVLADFSNTTGEAVFDVTLREALAAQIEESPLLKIMSDAEVNQALQLMGRSAGEPLNSQLARQVCQRQNQKAVVGGSIARLGTSYAIALTATNCQTDESLAREQAEAQDQEHVLTALATAAKGMRAKLGESLSSVQKLDRPPDQVTTSSIEAYRAYALGREQFRQAAFAAAIPLFKRATELDPNFAMAYWMMGAAYGNLGDLVSNRLYLGRAFALVDRVSERERLSISGDYYRDTGEWDKAEDVLHLWAQTFPRDFRAFTFLGMHGRDTGEFQKSAEALQEALRLEPFNATNYANVMNAYIIQDRFEEAKALANKAFALKVNPFQIHRALLRISYMQSDGAAIQKEIQWFMGTPQEYASLGAQAQTALALGQNRAARELYKRAAELARQQNLPAVAASYIAPDVRSEALVGNCKNARPKTSSAVALALCGNATAGGAAVDEASKRTSVATLWNAIELPSIRASFEMLRDEPAKAVELLRSAAPYERFYPDTIYLRGLAYMRLGKGLEARAEFRKIVDHKGANWGVIHSVSILALGRATVLAGDNAQAKKAYEHFLALWKDADPDLPVLAQARKEFAAIP